MLKCGSDGWTRMEKRWLFCTWCCTKRCAENCRGATDSIHCRVWKKRQVPTEFRVFRNCRRSAKRNTTDGVVSVPVVMHCFFFFSHHLKKIDSVPQKTLWRARLHVQWDLCCVNCYLGANTDQCRLIFTTFFSPLLSFFDNIFSEKSLFRSFFQCLFFTM